MIVKISSCGKSFQGLSTYLTHDPDKAETEKRVAWAHTLNCAHDHVPSAVDEMVRTARNAELLKQEAGIRAGGRATESPVKHLSLNWAPDEDPSREQMIEATKDFLRHMKWDEHQALLIAHDDKEYRHVHVMLNAVHPETGLKLDESFENRRAQEWALEYEKEHRIYCEQRLLNSEEREDSPTRPAWKAFEKRQIEFQRQEEILRKNELDFSEIPENPQNADWKKLKEIQRDQREGFFAEGKSEFNEVRKVIYREVREEFREKWADFYAAKREGETDAAALAEIKNKLVAEQKEILEARRDEACKELRENRDGLYRELLDGQREARHAMRWRQEAGLDNTLFLEKVENGTVRDDIRGEFREAADALTKPHEAGEWELAAPREGTAKEGHAGVRSGADAGARIGEGIGFGLISLFESLADGFVGAKPDPNPPRRREPEPSTPNPFEAAANDARRRQQAEREAEDEEWRKRQRSPGE